MFKYIAAGVVSMLPAATMAATVTLSPLAGGGAGELYAGVDGFYLGAQDVNGPSGEITYAVLEAGRNNVIAPTDPSGTWTRWDETLGCNDEGAECLRGWAFSLAYFLPDDVIAGADGLVPFNGDSDLFDPERVNLVNYDRGMTPNFFATPELAIADVAGQAVATINLSEATEIGFFIYDDYVLDNQGGPIEVSFELAPVPLPASFALMGFALAGFAGLRRKH